MAKKCGRSASPLHLPGFAYCAELRYLLVNVLRRHNVRAIAAASAGS